MAKAKYMNKAKVKEFQDCVDQIRPLVHAGDFDRAFEILDEFRIGSNTLNPRGRNFAFWLVEEQSPGRDFTSKEKERRQVFEFTKLFIDKGVELDLQDRYGVTLLNWAVWNGCGELCEFLLERGASPHIVDVNKLPPLAYSMTCSARWNDSEQVNKAAPVIVPALLRAGADPYFAYPTYEEAKNNPQLSWALNGKRNDVVYSNFAEEIKSRVQFKTLPPELLATYKLFFQTCKELNLLRDEDLY